MQPLSWIQAVQWFLSSSDHSFSVPERSPGVQAGQHAAVSGGQPHSPGHVGIFAPHDATGEPQPTAAGHASRTAPAVKHSRPSAPDHHLLLLQPQTQPVSASSDSASEQPHGLSLPDLSVLHQYNDRHV